MGFQELCNILSIVVAIVWLIVFVLSFIAFSYRDYDGRWRFGLGAIYAVYATIMCSFVFFVLRCA